MSFKTFDIGGHDLAGRLGEALGTGLQAGYQQRLQRLSEKQKQQAKQVTPERAAKMTQTLIEKGMDPKIAQLYPYLTQGGQTRAGELGVEDIFRSFDTPQGQVTEAGQVESYTPHVDKIVRRNFSGRTPRERVKREDEFLKTNEERLQKNNEKLQSLTEERFRLGRLQELNQTDALPKGLERLNVSLESGELRLPFASSTESQEFIKIVNEFTTKAKESFGARVTNFELNRFMKRLPSLLNTTEGRERVLKQMNILNELNNLHASSVNQLFDQYGPDKFTYSQASSLVERLNRGKIEDLKNQYIGIERESLQTPKKTVTEKFSVMIDPLGQKRKVPRNQVKKAQEAGYKLSR